MKRIAILAVFACLFALDASSQTTSQISGLVSDPGGSVIPGAQVQVTNLDTNAVRTTQTGGDGGYSLTSLALGPYRIEVRKDGFQTYVQSGIVLQVGSSPAVNVALKLGNISQTVSVEADAAMVETQSTGVGQVIQPEQVVDLPLNGRQVSQLIGLSGASIANAAGGLTGSLGYPTAIAFSIAGSQGNETNYSLDGSPNMDYRTNVGGALPFPDALQEFKVETSALPADAGGRPGGSVGAVTKSGTNAIHGDLFEFMRNGIMNADSFQFGNTSGAVAPGVQDSLKRNTFGGTIGGPIRKNKVFAFYGMQGLTERSITTGTKTGLPTAATLKGDFTAFLAPPCQSKQIFLNSTIPSPISGQPAQQFTTAPNSNIILPQWLNTPSARISAKISAMLPTPIDACGNYPTVFHSIIGEYQHVARLDWQRTEKDSVFVRYFITDYGNPIYDVPGNLVLLNNGVGLADRQQSVSVGDTYSIRPTMINSLRLTFFRTAAQRTSVDSIPNICSLGMNAWCQLPHFMSGYGGFGAPGNLGWVYGNTYGVNDTVSWVSGSHRMSFGFAFQHAQMNSDGVYQVNPLPTVSTGSSSYTGQALAGFITGMADGYSQGGGQLGRDAENFPSLFFQDNWKVARRFQINAGLRWDPFFPQHTGYNMAGSFNLDDYNKNVTSKVYTSSPPGMTYPGDAGFNGTSVLPNHLANFSPRLGMVWDPFGKGMTSVRAGYGYIYSTTLMWNQMHVVLNPPYGGTVSFVPQPVNVSSQDPLAGGGIANPWFNQPGGNSFPTPEPPPSNYPFPQNGGYVFLNPNAQPSHTQSWNVSIQHQLTQNWLLSATYIGNKSSNQWLGQNIDQSVIITAGMTAPGIVSTAGMTGTSGPCTLLYGTQSVVFPTCNASATTKVNNVGNEQARAVLNLSNPKWGPYTGAAPGASVGGVIIANTNGYSNYNGLLVSVQHRLSHGVSILANYTLSHCIDLGEGGQDVSNSYQNPQNTGAEYGNCGQDRRHLVNASIVLQMPKLSNPWMERLFGGWTTSQIFTAASGSPFSVTDGSDVSLSSVGADKPNVVGNPFQPGPVAANPTCVAPTVIGTQRAYYNPCAFQVQPAGTFGNEGRNVLFGPGRYNIDTSIWRTFRVRERYKLDFRGEAFNILNHANWGNPSSSMSGTTGIITGANGAARILQVALKLNF